MSKLLHAQVRDSALRSEKRKLRGQGRVPGVVYGSGMERPVSIALEEKELLDLLRSHPHAVVDMEIAGMGTKPVMMKDIQRDTLNRQLLHIDFRTVDMNEKIKAPVRLELTGKSPGEREGGLLQLVLYEIEVECYPRDLPDAIEVDVSRLEMGEHLTVAELSLPAGVEATQDPDSVIVAVLAPQKERSEDELEAMEDEAEEDRQHARAAQAAETDA